MREARFGRLVILTPDPERTARQYATAFGWRTIADVEPVPGRRLIHVGPSSQPDAGVWFLRPESDDGRARVGAQTGGEPTMVLYVDDLEPATDRATAAGMTSAGEPGEDAGSRYLHLRDPLGNGIVLVQLLPRR